MFMSNVFEQPKKTELTCDTCYEKSLQKRSLFFAGLYQKSYFVSKVVVAIYILYIHLHGFNLHCSIVLTREAFVYIGVETVLSLS